RRDRAEAIELRLEEAIGKRLGQLEDVPVALPDLGAGRHIDECAGWLIRGRHSARGYFRQGTLYGFLAHGPLQACPKYRRCRGACFAALAIFQTALPQRTFRVVASCVHATSGSDRAACIPAPTGSIAALRRYIDTRPPGAASRF